MDREKLVQKLTAAILRTERSHPTRVGVDGVDAAGKTTLAAELSRSVEAAGRTVVRACIDGFHLPRSARYRQGVASPIGYFEDSFDHDALVDHVLAPLGPRGSLKFCGRVFDYRADREASIVWERAPADAVLLFDGVFLLRPELREYWDYSIFVHAEFETTLERAVQRDASQFESEQAVRERYLKRYIPGQRLYLERCKPLRMADVVVDNNDLSRPFIIRSRQRPGVDT